jgi:hypothetical protein
MSYCQSSAHSSTRQKGSSYPYSKASTTTATAKYRKPSSAPPSVAQAWLFQAVTWTTSSQKWTQTTTGRLASKNGGAYTSGAVWHSCRVRVQERKGTEIWWWAKRHAIATTTRDPVAPTPATCGSAPVKDTPTLIWHDTDQS